METSLLYTSLKEKWLLLLKKDINLAQNFQSVTRVNPDDLAWFDDRKISSYPQMNNYPIASAIEILGILRNRKALTKGQYFRYIIKLREINYRFIPLDEEEILAAKRDLDDKTYCQEYEGSYESFEGLAHYTYGQHNLALFQYDKNRIVSIGMDFNVDPMTCVIGHIIKDKFYQFGERYLINSNTYEMRDNLLETFNPTQVEIYPDSTGKARESNATESDLAILKKAGFTIKAHPSNPYVKDRINSVNSFVKNRNGGTRYKVNPETCPRTVNDFNRVERLEDGRLNKTQEEQGLKHITDGFGYLVSYKWPVKSREAYTITV